MPAGAINALDSITGTHSRKPKPYIILILLVIGIFVIIYSQRLLGIRSGYYNLFVILILLAMISVVISSTLVHNFDFNRNEYLEYFNHLFNSTPSRNFLLLFSYLLFVMFIYETAEYANNNKYEPLDKVLIGNNKFLSNRTYGLILIIIFGTYTGYSIYVTTNDC